MVPFTRVTFIRTNELIRVLPNGVICRYFLVAGFIWVKETFHEFSVALRNSICRGDCRQIKTGLLRDESEP